VALAVLVAIGTALSGHDGLWASPTPHVTLALVATAGALIAWHSPSRAAVIEAFVFP
jgi:hypothetical protein